jgi:hypothetical protein
MVPFFSQRHLFVLFEIFNLWDIGGLDQVFDFVGAVIHNDPFHTVFRVGLIPETLEHDFNERASIECGRAY